MTVSNMLKRGGSLINHLGRKWSADAVTHLGQKMKHNLHVMGRKTAGSLRTIANVGDRVLPTVQAIADVTGHPLASAAVEGLRRGVNAVNNMNGKVQHVRNAFRTV